MTQFAPETYPHSLWWYSYHFQLIRLKTVSGEFWRLFQARVPQQLAKLKIGPLRLDFAPETYRHSLGWNSYHFSSVRSKNVSLDFWQRFGFGHHRSRKCWKRGPRWLGLAPETYKHLFGVHFLLFPISTAKQCFGPIFTTFRGQGTTRAGPENAQLITGPGWPDFATET